MGKPRELERLTWPKTPRVRYSRRLASLLLGGSSAFATLAGAQVGPSSGPPIDKTSEETAKGHGSVSIGYQNTYINGMLQPSGTAPIGSELEINLI